MAGTSLSLLFQICQRPPSINLMRVWIHFIHGIMGNCINVLSHSHHEKIKVHVFNGELIEFKASTTVEKITSGPYIGYNLVHHARPFSPLPPNGKLEPGEVYHLVPLSFKPLVFPPGSDQENCGTQRVKIVLTKAQLEMLLSSLGKFKHENIRIWFSGSYRSGSEEGSHKWRPSLGTIKEVQGF